MSQLLRNKQGVPRKPNEPFCSNCGYTLTGLTDSTRCPECGRPIVEVLVRAGQSFARAGKRYRSRATMLGVPVIDVALGPANGEAIGRARGVIAIGDVAVGGIALGGTTIGIVSCGGIALGGFALGGLAVGAVGAIGGLAVGGLAVGGGAVGVLAFGGGAAGGIVQGGAAAGGWYARGGNVTAPHTVTFSGASSPAATAMFERLSWFFGTWPPSVISQLQPIAIIGLGALVTAMLIGAAALWRLHRDERSA